MLLNPGKTNLVDIYDAWRDHDLDRLASYLPSDFSHHINIPVEMIAVDGVRHGKEAAVEWLRQIFDSFDTEVIEPGPCVSTTSARASTGKAIACTGAAGLSFIRRISTSADGRGGGPSASPSFTTSRNSKPS